MEFSDKQITCVDCGEPFTFTAGEQRWYQERGFEREPRRCANCRKARKARDDGGGGHSHHDAGGGSHGRGGGQGGGGGRSRPKFKVTCSACGSPAEVPFEPRTGSPVYCTACFQARKNS